jgi:hypothetical protein
MSEPPGRDGTAIVEGGFGESSELDVRREAWDESRAWCTIILDVVSHVILPDLGNITETLDPVLYELLQILPCPSGPPTMSSHLLSQRRQDVR